MTEEIYDLGAFAAALAAKGSNRALAGMIRTAIDLHSLITDLQMAEDACEQMLVLLAGDYDYIAASARDTLAMSLLTQAILMYARGTKTGSKARKTIDVRSSFDAAQRAVHREICDLRDDAVAHFGGGGSYEGPVWVDETAFLVARPEGFRAAVVTKRIALNRELVVKLRDQTRAALAAMRIRREDCHSRMIGELDRAAADNPKLSQILHRHPLDLASLLGTEEAARQALQSLESGDARGRVIH
jgi:hypothetical protein